MNKASTPAGTNRPVKADARQRYAVQPPDMDSWPEPSISNDGVPRRGKNSLRKPKETPSKNRQATTTKGDRLGARLDHQEQHSRLCNVAESLEAFVDCSMLRSCVV